MPFLQGAKLLSFFLDNEKIFGYNIRTNVCMVKGKIFEKEKKENVDGASCSAN